MFWPRSGFTLTPTRPTFADIDRWMNPELPARLLPVPGQQVTQASLAYLDTDAPNAERWFICQRRWERPWGTRARKGQH